MNLPIVLGAVLAVAGFHTLLTRRNAAVTSETDTLVDLLTSQTGTGSALTLTGLLILVAALSRPAAWWSDSILDGSMPTGVYWLGVAVLLSGALSVTLTGSDRVACGGIALVGTGSALLFGLAGDLVAGITSIGVAAAGGWAALSLRAPEDRALPAFPEPLLLSVAVVGLIVLTASTVHRAATAESRLSDTHETGDRTLPRPTVASEQVAQDADDPAPSRLSQANPGAPRAASRLWLSLAASGLLIVVVAVGVWQQFSRSGCLAESNHSNGDRS